jgi:hypothetical protein
MRRRRRRTRAGVALLAAVSMAAAGCSSGGNAASTPVAAPTTPDGRLTPQSAATAFHSFTSNEDVSRGAGDERLALSWTNDGQSLVTAAKFRKAVFEDEPIARYTYGKPKLFVPRIADYPQWFMAVAERTEQPPVAAAEPAKAGADKPDKPDKSDKSDKDADSRTALMIFARKEPAARWRLGLATELEKGAKLPHLTVDAQGYAKPLATFDDGLLIQPRFVGAMQATLAEEGDQSLAADVVEGGKHTSDHYEKIQDKKKQMKEDGFAFDSIFTATQFPVYALRTNDGGGLVLYSMSRDTVLYRKSKKVDRIPIPRTAAHLLNELIMRNELGVVEMHNYAAVVPRKVGGGGSKSTTKTKIVGFAGDPVKATGS